MIRGVVERGVERGRERIGFSAIREAGDQKFITESLGMIPASEKSEQASRVRAGLDYDLVSGNEW